MINDTAAEIIVLAGTALCFAWLCLNFIVLLLNICRKRNHSIPYIRNYKNGSFVSNYLLMMLIYFVGILPAERDVFTAFSSAISEALDFVILKLKIAPIEGLMKESVLYCICVYGGYALVVTGTILFTLSLMQQYLWCRWKALHAKLTRKERMYLFGNNPQNLSICKSDGGRRFQYIVAQMKKEEREKLYIDGIPYLSVEPEVWFQNKLKGHFLKHLRKTIFVINTGDDKTNVVLCKCFVEAIATIPNAQKEAVFGKIRIYVFGDPKYQAIYENLTKKGFGCLNYINKYQKVAMDFIDRYPLTLFMDGEQIDYATSLVKEDVDINVALIGFGRTNRQIFLTSVASNQFLTASDAGPVHKPVNYFVFDKEPTEQNKNLNHDYYRFSRKLETIDPEDYLPMPALPAREQYFHMDINDGYFYKVLKQIVTADPKDANFIVIAFGNDLENLDMAHKLVEKCNEWDIHNVTIFVRAFEWSKEQTPLENKNCYFFGNEAVSVYDIDQMLSDKIYRMAKMRNEVMDLEVALTDQAAEAIDDAFVKENSVSANEKWYRSKSQMQRDSSLYACLSLRFKLNLMGLDYCAKDAEGEALTEQEYMRIYAGDDLPDIASYHLKANGKHVVCYGTDYLPSRRRNMAIQEHHRWTSFVISRGMVPASKEQILHERKTVGGIEVPTNGKNYELRRHGNLTSFEGLVEFRKMLAQRDGLPEEKKDRIRYRYQLLDDAYWLLDSNGYKIVRKVSCREGNCDILHGRPI